MKTKTLIAIISISLVSLLSGCATADYKNTTLQSDETISSLQKRVDKGDAAAMIQLAFRYAGDTLGKPDLNKANALYERAAGLDSMPANAITASRRYEYAKTGYQRNDALAGSYFDRANALYQQRTDWSESDKRLMAGAFYYHSRATGNTTDLCMAIKLMPDFQIVKETLAKTKKTCK